jgi:hypothetical protein
MVKAEVVIKDKSSTLTIFLRCRANKPNDLFGAVGGGSSATAQQEQDQQNRHGHSEQPKDRPSDFGLFKSSFGLNPQFHTLFASEERSCASNRSAMGGGLIGRSANQRACSRACPEQQNDVSEKLHK